ncbi:MAG: cupin domain-containing protein [Pseudomonadales bacterium]|nr:cupin domain-containing protein [Pseudomonadales bacterium]
MPPKRPIHEDEVQPQVWYAGTDREIHGRALCDVGGSSKIGVGLLELPPGCDTRPAHYHTEEEEHLYVLEGRATLHLGGERYTLVRGSYICFPSGQELHHYIQNDGSVVFRYLMIGERINADQVIYLDGC